MNKHLIRSVLVFAISVTLANPAAARGFGGGGGFGGGHFGGGFGGGHFGGFGGGHSFGGFGGGHGFGGFGGGDHGFGGGDHGFGGGDHGFGGGDHGFGGGDHGFGGGDHGFGGGDHGFGGGDHGFGGGFNGVGGGGRSGFGNYTSRGGFDSGFGKGGSGLGYRGGGGHLPTDGGFGHISGFQNRTPRTINNTDLSHQGASIRNSFNNDHFNHNTFNNVNVNHYGGWNHGYGGYGGWGHGYGWGGYGWHGGWGGWGYPGGMWGWPGGWWYPGWSEASAWTFLGVSTLLPFLGMAVSSGGHGSKAQAQPENVTYNNNNVYVNGQPAGTSQQYYQQAQQLANLGVQAGQATTYTQPQPGDVTTASYDGLPQQQNVSTASGDQSQQWQALGVFALAEPGQSQSNMLVQLAINPQGIIRGNYMNELTNEKSQVYGALDKSTQRISWTIGQNNSTVFDTSLAGLTKNDSQVLVHYGPDSTSTMALIRLNEPAQQSQPGQAQQGNSNYPPQTAPSFTAGQ